MFSFKNTIRILCLQGGGDALLLTPAIKSLKETWPESRIIVYVLFDKYYKEIFRHNPYIDKIRSANIYKNPVAYLLYALRIVKFYKPQFIRSQFAYQYHATEMIASMLGTGIINRKLHVFFSPEEEAWGFNLLKQYAAPIAINITSRCSANQMWPIGYWNRLVREMPEYTFIQLGFGDEQQVEGAVNMLGRTTVRQAMLIVKYARYFIGVDSILAHSCSAVNTTGVILFGDSSPAIWGHEGNYNLSKQLSCSPCNEFLDGHSCPYDIACMKTITVDEVKEVVWKLEAQSENGCVKSGTMVTNR